MAIVKRLLAAGACLLLLASCEIIFSTPFPAYLPLVEESADLRDEMPEIEDKDGGLRLTIIGDYLFLTANDDTLVILDKDLKVQETFEGDYGGRRAVTNGTNYYIGEAIHGPAPGFAYLGAIGGGSEIPTFYSGASFYGAGTDTSTNTYWVYQGAALPIGTTASASLEGPYRVERIFYDTLTGMVWVLFSPEGDDEGDSIFVGLIDAAEFIAPSGSFPYGNAYPQVNLPKADHHEIHYTRDGFCLAQDDGRRLLRCDFSGNEKEVYVGKRTDHFTMAFEMDGSAFYYYDGDARRLYRCNTWW